MCVKIISSKTEFEFDPTLLLESQICDSSKIIVDYDPTDSRIDRFMEQMDRIIKNGIYCSLDIEVNSGNTLDGLRFERKIESMNRKLQINGLVSHLAIMGHETDQKLCEIQKMCTKEI